MKLLCAVLLLSPLSISAADGDVYTGGTGFREPSARFLLCDSKTTTGACYGGNGFQPPPGYHSGAVNFEIAKDTGCTACSIEIRVGSGTDEKHLITTLTCGANTSYTLQAGLGLAGSIYPTVATATSCTDLDVAAHFSEAGP